MALVFCSPGASRLESYSTQSLWDPTSYTPPHPTKGTLQLWSNSSSYWGIMLCLLKECRQLATASQQLQSGHMNIPTTWCTPCAIEVAQSNAGKQSKVRTGSLMLWKGSHRLGCRRGLRHQQCPAPAGSRGACGLRGWGSGATGRSCAPHTCMHPSLQIEGKGTNLGNKISLGCLPMSG